MLKLVGKGPVDDGSERKRYLLFDSGCSACTGIAEAVEKETEGWLIARSLREAEVQEMMSKVRPNWNWEPTLLEVDGENTLVFTGLSMKIRMLMGLGPRRMARVAKIARGVQGAEIELSAVPSQDGSERYKIESVKYMDRRTALKTVGALGLSAILLGLLPQSVLAQSSTGNATTAAAKRRTKARVTKFNRSELKKAIAHIGKTKDGSKLQGELENRGFASETNSAQGGKVKSPQGNGSFVVMPYKGAGASSGQTAMLYFFSFEGREGGDFAIFSSNGEADDYAVVNRKVKAVRKIEDFEEYKKQWKRRLRDASQASSTSMTAGETTAASQNSNPTAAQYQYGGDGGDDGGILGLSNCDICQLLAGEILEKACDPYFALPAAAICELVTEGTCTIVIAIFAAVGYGVCKTAGDTGAETACGPEYAGFCSG